MDFSDEMVEEIFKIFQVESEEIIAKLNNSLLELDKRPNDKDAILMMFRDAHTLKGASRMVGFSNVQAVAHKMEDVLGLAKDNEIALSSSIVDALYKTVDFLSDLIQKSLSKGQEIYNEDIPKQIAILENIVNNAEKIVVKEETLDFDSDVFAQNIDKINELVSDSLFILMKIESGNFENSIKELLDVSNKLYEIFKNIGLYDEKKRFEDLKVKLEFITKASNSLTADEISEIQRSIDSTISKLISLSEIYNHKLVDYYASAFEKMSSGSHKPAAIKVEVLERHEVEKHEVEKSEAEEELVAEIKQPDYVFEPIQVFDINTIKEKLNTLNLGGTSGVSISELRESFEYFEQNILNEDVKNIIQGILAVFDFIQKNEIKPDEETISVIVQSVEYCDDILKNKTELADKELVLQRLEIIKQVLELNNQTTEDKDIIARGRFKIKDKKISEISDVFNTGDIKTLRVDSSKLDNLVSQVNELMITKIRTKKHLHELNLISQDLQEWQKTSTKVLDFLKHYDKKYFQSPSSDNTLSYFVKQLLGSFVDNNKKVFEAVNNISNLHRTIQEDDTKMAVVVDNIESMVKNIRILPLATVFHLFGRMVRDIAQEMNKKIDLEIFGSDTSTDKKIIEEIKAPLIHIIRNSIDHGIETPQERIALGKNPVGKIILSAKPVNNKVIIQIQDDGKGINIEKIKDKAIKKGYLTEEEINSMSDEQITNIIFAPGFSTGDEITNISGRGIGLDVVQTKISQLGGKVKIISEVNKGCCVQIELPAAMSTMQVFLVECSGQTFAIPMEAINTVLRKNSDEIILNQSKKSVLLGEKMIPLHSLSDILNLPKADKTKAKETILILQADSKIMALSVDKLLGDQEILSKKLSAPLYKLKNISGITTLVSGETCLILNISDILSSSSILKTPIQKAPIQKTEIKQLPKTSSYKILLVDDSITTRTLEKNILTKAGYNIETAESPIEAFEKIKTGRFDLIISDVEMPEMNGFEFLEKIKTDEMYSEIPVIMVSSLSSEDNKKKANDLGAKKYIVKGEFNQEDFLEVVRDSLL